MIQQYTFQSRFVLLFDDHQDPYPHAEALFLSALFHILKMKEEHYLCHGETGSRYKPECIVHGKNRYFALPSKQLYLDTGFQQKDQQKYLKILKQYGFVKVRYAGLPHSRYVRIVHKKIEEQIQWIVNDLIDQMKDRERTKK